MTDDAKIQIGGNVTAGRDATIGNNITKIDGMKITQNSPPRDMQIIVKGIREKIDGLQIDEANKIKIYERIDNIDKELKNESPNKASISKDLKDTHELLKEGKATLETIQDFGALIIKAAKWLGTTVTAIGWIL